MTISATCGICGDLVESSVPGDWHPSKLARRAEWDMQAHLNTHSFVELLRYEIRQDLEQVPEPERATIVRDIYRNLLGSTTATRGFVLGDADRLGVYSIEDALDTIEVYRLWRVANTCALPLCDQH